MQRTLGTSLVWAVAALTAGCAGEALEVEGMRRPSTAGSGADELAYEFNTDGDREGWSFKTVTELHGGPQDGKWIFSADQSDPRLIGPAIHLAASSAHRIKIKMANNGNPAAGSTLQVFWQTAAEPSFSGSRSLQIAVGNGGGWQEHALDVGRHAGWSGEITKLRVDPIRYGDGHGVGVDYVRVVKELGPPVELFDAVQLLRPTQAPKRVWVFSDKAFNSACRVDYWLDAAGELQRELIYHDVALDPTLTPDAIKKDFFKPAAMKVTTWNSERTIPLCSAGMAVSSNDQGGLTLASAVGPLGKRPHIVQLNPSSFAMREHSAEVMATVFGGTEYFRDVEDYPGGSNAAKEELGVKLNQYVTLSYPETVWLADYHEIQFSLTATPTTLSVNQGCVANPEPDARVPNGEWAQRCYESNNMASQFRLALGNVTWTDPQCTKRITDPVDPLFSVCQYYGDFLYMTLSIHDERREFHEGDFFLDPGTQSYIYRVDMRDFLPPGTTENPFKKKGVTTTLSGDLLGLLRGALLAAEAAGHVPPRREIQDGSGRRPETDAEYLAHYSMTNANLGYEVTGNSAIRYEVRDFKLVAYKK